MDFLSTCDRLKSVQRTTYPRGVSRPENSAEHSWRVSLMALTLGEPLRIEIWDSRAQSPDLTLTHLLRLGPLIDIFGLTTLYAGFLPEQVGRVSVELPELD